MHLCNLMVFVDSDCFPFGILYVRPKGFFCSCLTADFPWWHWSVVPLLGIYSAWYWSPKKTVISGRRITQYLLCLERNKRTEKMGKGPKRKRDEERKKTSNMCFLPRDLSACKLTLIISWHLRHVIFQMRPYSYICRERLGSCG